ncbi:MAG: hypothetical protein FHP94_15135 [Denitromonas halophila]|nr:MAG: hypothetical protein FHP94_15135 [Denitromonas halophila]TVT67131.1 MAG: hypothetical protein FHP93_18145 [Denitromonas halophila]
MPFRHLLAPRQVTSSALAETVVLPLLLLALAWWLNPTDPLFAWASFPWPILGPLLLALRYGPMMGVIGSIVLLGGWLGLTGTGKVSAATPQLYFLGTLVLVMVCGEFASIWRSRVRRAETHARYVQERLDHLTRQHYLLRVSHDRLEQDLISRPVSMRDALTGLRELLGTDTAGPLPGADALLKLLAQFCQIERAALYPSDTTDTPAGQLGAPFAFAPKDPLVLAAATEIGLCHVASDALPEHHGSQYLVVSRLRDLRGTDHGVLVVESMPFFALNEDSLQIINLLVGYYADSLASRDIVRPVLAVAPACPTEFALELQRMWHVTRNSGLPSALVVLTYRSRPVLDDLPLQWHRLQRTLDVIWHTHEDDRHALLVLMPLAGPAAIEGYLDRIDAWLTQHLGAPPGEFGIALHAYRLDATPATELLSTLLEDCHVRPAQRPVSTAA